MTTPVESFIARMTLNGWQVIHQTDTAVQLKKPRQFNRPLLLIGGLLVLFYGIGIPILVFAIADYLFKRDQTVYATLDQINSGTVKIPSPIQMKGPMIFGVILLGLFFLWLTVSVVPLLLR